MAGTPMVDDIALAAVQFVRQETNQDFVEQRIAGFEGTHHERLGRQSHRVLLRGILLGDTALDDLHALQEKSSSGGQVSFAADITTALAIEKMVIESFAAEQEVGRERQFSYALVLAEDPPLPPPAELSAFGGLDDFGTGDLGFDDVQGLLDDVAGQAGALTDALDGVMEAVGALGELAAFADLGDVSNPLQPLSEQLSSLGNVGSAVSSALGPLSDLVKK